MICTPVPGVSGFLGACEPLQLADRHVAADRLQVAQRVFGWADLLKLDPAVLLEQGTNGGEPRRDEAVRVRSNRVRADGDRRV
jgi:hypothetical protein